MSPATLSSLQISRARLGSLTGAHSLPSRLQTVSSNPGQHMVLGVRGSGGPAARRCRQGADSPCLPGLLWRAGPAGAVRGGRQLPHLRHGRRQQPTISQARAERGHQPGTALPACEKEGVSFLLHLCHFSITHPKSVRKLYLRLPPSL